MNMSTASGHSSVVRAAGRIESHQHHDDDHVETTGATDTTDQHEDRSVLIDPTTLKQRQTTSLAKVTRKRNELVKLMLNEDNLHDVKTQLNEYDQLFISYQEAHNILYDALITEDAQYNESKRYREHETEISVFRQNVLAWINETEHKLHRDLDQLSIQRSKSSRSSRASSHSKSSSTKSARLHEKAKLAALLVEREQMSKQLEIEREQMSRHHEIEAEKRKLQLELEINKSLAKEKVYTAEQEVDTHSQLDHDRISLLAKSCHSNIKAVRKVIHESKSDPHIVVSKANMIPENTDRVSQADHVYANVKLDNPVSAADVTSVKTIYHDMRLSQDTRTNEFHHDVYQNRNERHSISQPHMENMHQLDPEAACFQPSVNTGSYNYQASIQDLVTSITLPHPDVPEFSGDPIEYHTFIMAFDTRIVSKTASSSDRLYYLNQYLVGEAKEFISGCLHMNPVVGYPEARRILQQEYGDTYKVSSAYIDKVLSWNTIKHDDSLSLRKFAIFLNKCLNAMQAISSLTILNHLPNLQAIVSKLPGYLQNKWRERAIHIKTMESHVANFQDIVTFINKASDSANDPVFGKLALTKYSNNSAYSSNKGLPKHKSPATQRSFAVTLSQQQDSPNTGYHPTRSAKPKCLLCNKPHDLDTCYVFLKKTIDERRAYLKEKRLCFGCFGMNHTSKGCLNKRTCNKCNKKHPTSLHIDNFQFPKSQETPKEQATPENSESPDTVVKTSCFTSDTTSTVLQAIIPVKIHQEGSNMSAITYAFFDNGSNGCFLTDDLQQQINAKGLKTTLVLRTMNGESRVQSLAVNGLVISSISGENPITLPKCFTREEIPIEHSQIPKPDILSKWSHLHEATKEMSPYIPNLHIGLLIGSNCVQALQPIKVIPSSGNGPYAVKYLHGWTINGPIRIQHSEDDTLNVTHCNRINVQEIKMKEVLSSDDILRLFDSDFEDLYLSTEPGKLGLSQEDRIFMEKAASNIQHIEGHYILPLPFRESNVSMPYNYNQALKRATWQKKKMLADSNYHSDYVAFMNNLFQHNYARKVLPENLETEKGKVWYLPHHAVYHPIKGKMRVVFDCSAKYGGTSLNDQLLQGPDLTNTLLGVLTRFRQERIAFIGDIDAMFHQVRVASEHQDFLRFLWWPQGDLHQDLEEYSMKVHLFGATSSPSIANLALRETAVLAEKHVNISIADTIRKNFYVDDCLKSVPTVSDAIEMISDLQKACKLGGFKISKFSSNHTDVLSSIPVEDRSKDLQKRSLDYSDLPAERALGVFWDVNSDTFGFLLSLKNKPLTRRGILSMVSSIYDPLGFIAPFVLHAKRILQDLCREKYLGWDDIISDDYITRWNQWLAQLQLLHEVQVERCLKPMFMQNIISSKIHVFCDASTSGYGSVAYLRLVDISEKIQCSFLMGKARLAPIKQTTVPRLELTAATVAVRLGRMLLKELDMSVDGVVYHTDSTTVLHYLQNTKKRFPVFVANRVQFILDYSETSEWRYVETKINPADYASRGMNLQDIMKIEGWFKGPSFLWSDESKWPLQPACVTQDINIDEEITTANVIVQDEIISPTQKLVEYFSDWFHLKHAVAVYRKIIQILQHRKDPPTTAPDYRISVNDIDSAGNAIISYVQLWYFADEVKLLSAPSATSKSLPKSSNLYQLDPFMQNCLLKVGGRLSKSNMSDTVKYPILLPRSSHVTTLVIQNLHIRLVHAGRNHVLACLRESFWVIHANSAVRRIIASCITCKKFRKPTSEQKMADLPPERCSMSPPFTYTGVDLFGPFIVKQGRKSLKRYGVLFTCLSSRAVHIEVSASLDTASFINALRRCIARRGPIAQLRCDNGTNFVGAERELRDALNKMDNDTLRQQLLKQNIQWVFNPPAASHFGGIWERQIRTVRKVLSHLSQEFSTMFDDESFHTLMCEVEAIINSRPLTTVSGDPNDMEPLTPNHILTMKSNIILPPPGSFQHADIYMRKRWRRVQYAANIFWTRWKREYLLTLQCRQKWNKKQRNMEIDDIVLLKDDSLPRNSWSMGRIICTEPDKKGLVRSCTVKTSTSTLRRPIDRLVLLIPVEEQHVH